MCRGIEESEVQTIKQGLMIENTVYAVSRAYVPLRLFQLYRRGVFKENFTFGEFKYVAKIFIFMQLIECLGHLAMKKYCQPVYMKHIGIYDDKGVTSKAQMDDYITQKNYFRAKKTGTVRRWKEA